MSAVVSDIIEGTLEIKDGIASHARTFLVPVSRGLAGHGKQWAALQSQKIPRLNDPHPSIPGIVARRFAVDPTPQDNITMRVVVGYEEPPAIEQSQELGSTGKTVEVSIDTFTEATLFDKDGNLMQISFAQFQLGSVSVLKQNLEFQIERPTATVRITEETTRIPKRFIQDGFVGSVNSVEWSGFPPRTWLLRGISTTQVKQGRNRVSWVFTYNRRQWRAEGRIQENGRVPENATIENGIAFFNVYPELDFKLTGQEF